MPEAVDILVISDYVANKYMNQEIVEVITTSGYEGVTRLLGYRLTGCMSHGKLLIMEWQKEESVLYSTLHLMIHGRLYDLDAPTPLGHRFTLRLGGGGLSLFDHMAIAKLSVSEETPDLEGKCVMFGVEEEDVAELVMRGRRRSIASVLLAQQVIVGTGTVMCSEILHEASLHPSTPCSRLSSSDVSKLSSALNRVPSRMYHEGSFKHRSPVMPDGSQGSYQPVVHGRSTLNEKEVKKIGTSGRQIYTIVEGLSSLTAPESIIEP